MDFYKSIWGHIPEDSYLQNEFHFRGVYMNLSTEVWLTDKYFLQDWLFNDVA
jgi:hypothetical protein